MLYVNDEWKKEPVFSKYWWKGHLTFPNFYMVDGIQDLIDNRDQIIPTPRYKRLVMGNFFHQNIQ